jgi:hypothetical protein
VWLPSVSGFSDGTSTVRYSDALDRFQPSGLHRLHELLVVLLVLVGVPFGEAGDRRVEDLAVTQVLGDGDRVPGPGVRPGKRPLALRSSTLGCAIFFTAIRPTSPVLAITPPGAARALKCGQSFPP